MVKRLLSSLLACLLVTPAASFASTFAATVTADNHYALYYGTETHLTFVGRNEKGWASDTPGGAYNWSLPETFSGLALGDDDRFFVVHWDESIAGGATQAWVGQFVMPSGLGFVTDSSNWGYFLTATPNPGTNGDAPTIAELEAILAGAFWSAPGFSAPNGTGTWSGYSPSPIPGISTQANWISRTSETDSSYFLTVYRSVPMKDAPNLQLGTVPEPGTLALLGLGLAGLAATRRRSK